MIVARNHAGGAALLFEPRHREACDLLRMRADQLVGADRALMALYLEGGNSYRQIARLTGQYPTSVARRIRRISQRLLDETYPLCLQSRAAFSPFELAVIRDYFVRGFSCDKISRRHRATVYRIRSIVISARRFTASVSAKPEPTPQRSRQQ